MDSWVGDQENSYLSNIELMYFAKDILNSPLKLNVYQTDFAFDDWKSYGAYVANFNKNLI